MKKADGVFEGGGVKGIGLVGALTVAEEEGYKDWQRVAGPLPVPWLPPCLPPVMTPTI